ncbi:hypothetical protein AB0M11_08155 [Streptomyces sp. NPDC051987]|uniref:hypothetical protein n=1 Tax=Streptomyces sp. NPDC051987 TaxID=3155808 RepID=UPI003431FA16
MKLPRVKLPSRPRRTLTDVTDVAGIGCLVGAAWWWQPIAGLVALGVALIVIGWAVGE